MHGYGHYCLLHVSTICSSYCHEAKLNQKHESITLFGPNISMIEKQMGQMLVLHLPSTSLVFDVACSPLVLHKMHTGCKIEV